MTCIAFDCDDEKPGRPCTEPARVRTFKPLITLIANARNNVRRTQCPDARARNQALLDELLAERDRRRAEGLR